MATHTKIFVSAPTRMLEFLVAETAEEVEKAMNTSGRTVVTLTDRGSGAPRYFVKSSIAFFDSVAEEEVIPEPEQPSEPHAPDFPRVAPVGSQP